MSESNISKRDGVIIVKNVKRPLAKKKRAKKMDTISGVPLDVVENKG